MLGVCVRSHAPNDLTDCFETSLGDEEARRVDSDSDEVEVLQSSPEGGKKRRRGEHGPVKIPQWVLNGTASNTRGKRAEQHGRRVVNLREPQVLR